MGEAIWLYMLLLDKITSVTESGVGTVLGGKPLKHSDILEYYPLLPRITYARYVGILKAAGYIETKRTPVGLVFKVLKAKKIFNSDVSNVKHQRSKTPKADVSKTTHQKPSDVSKMDSDVSKMRQTNKTRQLQDNSNTTNVVLGAKAPKAEIDFMFEVWEKLVGYKIESRVKANRFACNNLLKKHGTEKLEQLIRGVALAQNDRYAPRISDFCSLQQKLNDLIVWGRQRQNNSSVGVVR